jgi:hypothetical protein
VPPPTKVGGRINWFGQATSSVAEQPALLSDYRRGTLTVAEVSTLFPQASVAR